MTGTNNARQAMDGGDADSAALFGDLPATVRFELEPARRFLDSAVQETQRCLDSRNADGVPSHPPRATALLFGQVDGNEITISDIEFVPNIRDSDESVQAEFEATIAPRFGEVYRNPGRGFWSDEKGVLRAIKRHAVNDLELMGSIHSHPNWHEIGPPHERYQQLSENPTRMDEYLFRQSCWPVNVIWYVRAIGGGMTHRVAGWRSGPELCARLDIRIPQAICEEFSVASQGEEDMPDVSQSESLPVPVVTVKLPAAFHGLSGGRRRLPVEGGNVRAVLIGLDQACPGVLARLVDQDGSVKRYVNVYRNDSDIRGLDGLDTAVEKDDVIWIVPAVAGGCGMVLP